MNFTREPGDRADRERRAAAGVAVDLREDRGRSAGTASCERLRDARRPPGRSSRRRRAASRPGWTAVVRRRRSRPSAPRRRVSRPAVSRMIVVAGRGGGRRRAPPRGDVDDRRARRARDGPGCRAPCRASRAGRRRPGRYGSAATSSGRRPCLTRCRASFAEDVVLPEPWRPTSAMTAGLPCRRNVRSPAPSSSTSSSWTIFTTCWPAVRLCEDLRADGLLADAGDEVLDDLEVDVGLEQARAGSRASRRRRPPR